jgi:hypothetical protein
MIHVQEIDGTEVEGVTLSSKLWLRLQGKKTGLQVMLLVEEDGTPTVEIWSLDTEKRCALVVSLDKGAEEVELHRESPDAAGDIIKVTMEEPKKTKKTKKTKKPKKR